MQAAGLRWIDRNAKPDEQGRDRLSWFLEERSTHVLSEPGLEPVCTPLDQVARTVIGYVTIELVEDVGPRCRGGCHVGGERQPLRKGRLAWEKELCEGTAGESVRSTVLTWLCWS